MNELAIRTITGIALIAIALAAVFVGGYAFPLLAAGVATAVFYEWTRLTRGWGGGWYVGGLAYALAAALSLLWIRDRSDNGAALVLWVFIIVWSTDIGAYFTGRTIGGPKLAPAISPGKTWAGLYGGIAAATVLGGTWAYFEGLYPVAFLLAPLFSVSSQGGDLFESW